MKKFRLGTLLNQFDKVINDGNTIAWFDTDDVNMFTADSIGVSIWWDKIGNKELIDEEISTGSTVINTVYQITATTTDYFYTGCKVGDTFYEKTVRALNEANKVKKYAGVNICNPPSLSDRGKVLDGYIEFSGSVSQGLSSYAIPLNQPITVYIVVNQLTWVLNKHIFDTVSPANMFLRQRSVLPNIAAYAGIFSSEFSELGLNEWAIIRVVFNGANSELAVNNNTPIVGDFGTGSFNGITIAGNNNRNNSPKARYKTAIWRKGIDNQNTREIIYDYLQKKNNLTDGFVDAVLTEDNQHYILTEDNNFYISQQ
jgi:hypothetical protein